jgi:putative redox protein
VAAAKPAEKKPPARVHAVWHGEQRFESGRPGGPTLKLDGTGKTAQNPVDGVLSALAGCTGIDIVEILAKRRTPVERLEIEVVGERSEGVPRRSSPFRSSTASTARASSETRQRARSTSP